MSIFIFFVFEGVYADRQAKRDMNINTSTLPRITTTDGATVGLVNQPVVHWLQGDNGPGATPGGWVRLFGRNLGWPEAVKGFTTKLLLRGPKKQMNVDQLQ